MAVFKIKKNGQWVPIDLLSPATKELTNDNKVVKWDAENSIFVEGNMTFQDDGGLAINDGVATIDVDGNAWFSGDVKVGINNEVLATETYVKESINGS